MRGRVRILGAIWLLGSGALWGQGLGAGAVAGKGSAACRQVVIEGEAKAGSGFERPFGNGLKVLLEPLASGWILRVVPSAGPRGQHDYAELATPPYRSVNPLLISTGFSFRAQDVVGWNPRPFRFAASAAEFARLSSAYANLVRTARPSAADESALAVMAAHAHQGRLEILDARLVPGTADQSGAAAMVASHFATTPHSLEQSASAAGTPLGRVTWMRFRIVLELPAGFRADRGVAVRPYACS